MNERVKLLNHLGVNTVLDVGANDGGYGKDLRRYGYRGAIVSYEPLTKPRERLRSVLDADWRIEPYALGDSDGTATMNVAGNDEASSSVLDMLETHRAAAPTANYVGVEQVQVRRLDGLWRDQPPGGNIFLKIDVQGYESHVLDGAPKLLERVVGVQLEMSLTALYDGAPTWRELVDRLTALGLDTYRIDSGFRDPATGRMLQVDGTFCRAPSPSVAG